MGLPNWLKDGGRYRIRTYPHSTFSNTCGTRVATKRPQWKPTEQLLDTNWTRAATLIGFC